MHASSRRVFEVLACVPARSKFKTSPLRHRRWVSSVHSSTGQAVTGSESESKDFPVIDLSAFTNMSESDSGSDFEAVNKDSKSQSRNAAKRMETMKLETATRFREVCTQTGFFYLTGHGIDDRLLNDSLLFARRFFDLPAEKKNKLHITISEDLSRGYQKVGDNITGGKSDAHEAFDAMREIGWTKQLRCQTGYPPQKIYHGGQNLWPDDAIIPGFRDFYEKEYWPAMIRLGEKMMRCFALSLKIDEHALVPMYDESFYVFRAIHYPPGDSNTGPAGCGEHTDYGCFTFVHSEPVPGALEVRTRSGTYLKPECKEGMFICNIGDMIELLTGGLYVSTKHRVVSSPRSRVSVPFFFELNYDSYVEPLLSSPLVNAACSADRRQEGAIRYGDHLYQKTSTNFMQVH
mmetsp:Transcript_22867/g.27993  ORF Transcript_22867/g.27993 Transcript_22867/m.27993 type:complete len:404 (-) Transcript_22867:1794-3005(-)